MLARLRGMTTNNLQVLNPFADSPVAEVPVDTATSIERKLAAAVAAQAAWRKVPLQERMERVAQAFDEIIAFGRRRDGRET